MRRLWVPFLLSLVLVACGSTPEVPTPLPTAVPPSNLPEPGNWAVAFTYEFPPGTLGVGPHRYAYLIRCPVLSSEDTNTEWSYFEIANDVAPQPDPLYLRIFGLSGSPVIPSRITNTKIHPDRPIVAVVHLIGMTQQAANLTAEACEIVVFWDDVGRQLLAVGEPFED